jgi:hypothetical protein
MLELDASASLATWDTIVQERWCPVFGVTSLHQLISDHLCTTLLSAQNSSLVASMLLILLAKHVSLVAHELMCILFSRVFLVEQNSGDEEREKPGRRTISPRKGESRILRTGQTSAPACCHYLSIRYNELSERTFFRASASCSVHHNTLE